MKALYQAKDRIEAQLLKDHLADWHIDTVMQGDYLTGAAGELPALSFPVLWVVEDRDLARARQLVTLFFQQEQPEGWRCDRCGEQNEGQFGLCWQCSTPRPL